MSSFAKRQSSMMTSFRDWHWLAAKKSGTARSSFKWTSGEEWMFPNAQGWSPQWCKYLHGVFTYQGLGTASEPINFIKIYFGSSKIIYYYNLATYK